MTMQSGFVLRSFLLSLFCLSVAQAGNLDPKPMTQGELARRVAFLSGVADGIPAPVTGDNSAAALTTQGWVPIEGWRVSALATKDDFYVVMAKYLGLKVKNPDDPNSYYEALTAAGFTFGTKDSAVKVASGDLAERDRSISKLVIEVKGNAEYCEVSDGTWVKLGKLQVVKEGMSFRTGPDSYIDVVYARGAAQRIYEQSEVKVEMLREEEVAGNPVRAVVIYISKGTAVSLVDPMNKASQFVMRDPFGAFEVDKASGCQFTSQVSDDQSLTLNPEERRLAHGYLELLEVQPRECKHVVSSGGGTYTRGVSLKRVGSGQSLVATLNPGAPDGGIQVLIRSAADFRALLSLIREASSLPTFPPHFADDRFLTMPELVALLEGLGGSGVSANPASNAVTPIH